MLKASVDGYYYSESLCKATAMTSSVESQLIRESEKTRKQLGRHGRAEKTRKHPRRHGNSRGDTEIANGGYESRK